MGNFSRLTPALWAGKEGRERDGKELGGEKVDDGTATGDREILGDSHTRN